MGTIAVAAVLVIIVASIIAKMVSDRRKGKSSCHCGGNCGACGGCQTANACKCKSNGADND